MAEISWGDGTTSVAYVSGIVSILSGSLVYSLSAHKGKIIDEHIRSVDSMIDYKILKRFR